MGFGLCAFGFLLLCVEGFGLDTVGYGVIAYGFWRVSDELKENRGYKIAAIAAAAGMLPALLGVYEIVASLSSALPTVPNFMWAVKGVLSAVCFVVLCFSYCGETAKIAADGGAKIFSLRAKVTMYLSVLYSALLVVSGFMGTDDGTVALIIILGKFIVPIINAFTTLTCFTTITTSARKEIEEEIIEMETEKLVRKRMAKGKKGKKNSDDDIEEDED